MSANDDPSYRMWLRIDDACDRFAAAWRTGSRPDLTTFAADVPAAERSPFVLALLAVDVEFRRNAGERPTTAEYRARFPELDARELDRLIGDAEATAGVPTTHAPTVPEPPETQGLFPAIPGYRVECELARGGMGRVLAAHDLTLDREVAIKVLRPELSAAEAGRRFTRESIITGKLAHPGIPPVHALGTLADGSPFLAMKLVRGETLAELLTAANRGKHDLIRVFEQICEAVGFAHSVGVIHRDLKPQNVMVGEFGEVQVMDWGLAKAEIRDQKSDSSEEEELRLAATRSLRSGARDSADPSADETRPGSVFGTIPYMPPEQARGELNRVGPRADAFSLGGILCTILTGKPPYSGRPARALLTMAENADLEEAFARLDECAADPELIALAKRCLRKDPEQRPADGKAVADAVAAHRAGAEQRLRRAEQERAAAVVRTAEQRKKRRVQLALAGAVALGALAAVVFAWRWQVRNERDEFDRFQTTERQQRELEQRDAAARVETARLEERQLNELRTVEQKAEQQRGVQEKQARAGVDAALKQSAALRRLYRFAEARKAVDAARNLAGGELTPDLGGVVAAAQRDLEFVIQLDEIRMRRSRWLPEPGGKSNVLQSAYSPPAYRAAFREWGLDPLAGDPVAMAKRVNDSPIRAELLAALDDWTAFERDFQVTEAVLAVVRRADPGPWLDRFRDLLARANRKSVAALAAAADPFALPPTVLVALCEVMKHHDLDPTPLLMAALARHPNEFLLAFDLGVWFMTRSDPVAVGYFRAARSLRPENPQVATLLGIALKDEGDADSAIAAFRDSIRLEARDPIPHVFLAIELKKKDDLPEAIKHLRRAVELDPENAMVMMILGITLHENDEVKEALAVYLQAAALTPDDPRPWSAIGIARSQLRDRTGAIAAFRKAIELGSQDKNVFVFLGNALKEDDDLEGAIAAYRKAIKLDPKSAEIRAMLAIALSASGDEDGAIAAYRRSLELNPKEARVHALLGLALRDRGDLDGAIHHLRAAYKLGYRNARLDAELKVLEAYQFERDDTARRRFGVIVP